MTESGFQPIGVAVSCFSIKPPAKHIKGYRGFAAPAFELRQVAFIVKKTFYFKHRVLLLMLCFVFSLFCFASGKKVMERKQRESAARSAGLSGRQTGSKTGRGKMERS